MTWPKFWPYHGQVPGFFAPLRARTTWTTAIFFTRAYECITRMCTEGKTWKGRDIMTPCKSKTILHFCLTEILMIFDNLPWWMLVKIRIFPGGGKWNSFTGIRMWTIRGKRIRAQQTRAFDRRRNYINPVCTWEFGRKWRADKGDVLSQNTRFTLLFVD